jgi:hypothetical protein
MRTFHVQGAVLLTAFLGLAGCADQSQVDSNPPQPPAVQEPGPQLVEHGQGWEEYQQSLDELTSMRSTIESKYNELSRQAPPASGEPVFTDQASTKKDEIVKVCDSLESGAQKLLDHPYLREHKGQSIDATDLIRYAREMREKIQSGS